ncbi:MAG: DUF5305 domain-containing protein [Defluviitaleaceae bacterium]|nr:DUF5305 domain-containing protein [Defluviitaleaceae bacterium]
MKHFDLNNFKKYRQATFMSFMVLLCFILAAMYVADYIRGETVVNVSGRHTPEFRVFYRENPFFPDSTAPVPRSYSYLLSLTDYFEFDSIFNLSFDSKVRAEYSYSSQKRFVIRYLGTTGGSNSSPILYEEIIPLSEFSDSAETDFLRLEGNGSYKLDPWPFIRKYEDFINMHTHEFEKEGIAANVRGFSAELHMDFTYKVDAPRVGIRESVTHGYMISISDEVYSLVSTGTPIFENRIVTAVPNGYVNYPMMIAFVIVMSLSVFGLIRSINKLNENPNANRQLVLTFLRKYSNEIVVSESFADMSTYSFLLVEEFEDLLRLAVNLNKHIMCHRQEHRADFYVLVDAMAYHFPVDYEEKNFISAAPKKFVRKEVEPSEKN